MIFLTTGTQLPFDRLVRAVDDWADRTQPEGGIVAQVLPSSRAPYVPRNFAPRSRLSPAEYDDLFGRARLVISHAGMGTILTALMQGKRLCVMPRQFRYGEHRNDHQLATVERLGEYPGLYTALDEQELPVCLDAAVQAGAADQGPRLDQFSSAEFTSRLRTFLLSGKG